ncbi:hypothetical protein [Streptomyces sp. NPDC020965]|uniref:hypothetical protein n=1 Tax=Streptomyces sp. NPDC020965 TaxID=3365105 RepID=UPI0037953266
MQTSAAPDPAHTRTRPAHWLAIAAALAAVVTGAGLLQPDQATASRAATDPGRTITAAPAPDPSRVRLPLECGTVAGIATKQATGDLDGDGRPETVVAGRCAAGSGTPPSGLYVLTGAGDPTPRLIATLLEPAHGQSVAELAINDGVISATLLGYSSPDVPGCCPDQREQTEWQWRDGKFVRAPQAGTRGV